MVLVQLSNYQEMLSLCLRSCISHNLDRGQKVRRLRGLFWGQNGGRRSAPQIIDTGVQVDLNPWFGQLHYATCFPLGAYLKVQRLFLSNLIDISQLSMEGPKLDVEKCKQFVEKEFMESALPSLVEFVKIENMSKGFYTPEEWQAKGWDRLAQAGQHVKKWIEGSGIQGAKVQIISNREQNLTPLIFIEVEGQVPDTYLFYGHYDKQPPFEGWNAGFGAYEPVLYPSAQSPEKLYGRGGADDGYSAYGSIIAIKVLQDQKIPTPRCVIIIEGDEQSGTGDVQKHVQSLKERIGDPKVIFCLDSGTLDYERLWATTSLRGYLMTTVRVDVLTEGVHSGSSSGYVPSSFRILRSIIQRLQNQETGYMIKDLEVEIPPNRYKELYELAQQLGQGALKQFPTVEGIKRPSESVLESVLLGGWKPQLAVTGIEGLPALAKAGNVMLPYTTAKLSIRLPPTKNPQEAKAVLQKILKENPPYNAKVTISNIVAGEGFNSPVFPQALEDAFEEASQTYFGKKYLTIAEGGSIPFMGFLSEKWPAAKFIVTGVLGPASNAHGPNEFLHIPYTKKLICSMAHVLANTIGKI